MDRMASDARNTQPDAHAHTGRTIPLALAALGIAFGDIGTSPLYAFRAAMLSAGARHGGVNPEDVFGILSMIVWALVLVVTLKYVLILLRADNDGEGGTLSLLALAQRQNAGPRRLVLLLGLVGAALFYGDSVITPAISVLSALEGMELVAHNVKPLIGPIAITIIVSLFLVQSRGTETVARFFGPVMLLWFVVMALGALPWIVADPGIFAAVNPICAARFLAENRMLGLLVLGSVFLAVTGAEALYADMGHFGRRPIQTAWLFVAFPALLLNYFGQGAMLLAEPARLRNPFFQLFPEKLLVPVVVLATLATVIASQAVLTGTFSLTRQAIRLRLLPRMRIRHTSDAQQGQIYMPGVNFWLMAGVLILVVIFPTSESLAAAYGISVTGTMVVTTMLAMIVAHRHWGMSPVTAVLSMLPFLLLDLVFLGANMIKIGEGGWLPLMIAMTIFLIMVSWRRGTSYVAQQEIESEVPLSAVLRQFDSSRIATVAGTGVFFTSTPDLAPTALMHSLKHFKALHENNVILTIVTANLPRVPESDRVKLETISPRFMRVTLTFGYAEEPDVPRALLLCRKAGWKFDIMSTSFVLSRRRLRLHSTGRLPRWQARLFFLLSRNSAAASDYFRIPAGRVVEIGVQVNI